MDASRHQLTVAPRSCALKRWQSASRLGFETKRPPVQIRPPRPDQKACDSHQVSSWLAARRTLLIWLVTVLAVGMAVAAGVVIEGRTAFGGHVPLSAFIPHGTAFAFWLCIVACGLATGGTDVRLALPARGHRVDTRHTLDADHHRRRISHHLRADASNATSTSAACRIGPAAFVALVSSRPPGAA